MNCLLCGKEITYPKSYSSFHKKRKKFCDVYCNLKFQNRNRIVKTEFKNCLQCKKDFENKGHSPKQRERRKFCSQKCANVAHAGVIRRPYKPGSISYWLREMRREQRQRISHVKYTTSVCIWCSETFQHKEKYGHNGYCPKCRKGIQQSHGD